MLCSHPGPRPLAQVDGCPYLREQIHSPLALLNPRVIGNLIRMSTILWTKRNYFTFLRLFFCCSLFGFLLCLLLILYERIPSFTPNLLAEVLNIFISIISKKQHPTLTNGPEIQDSAGSIGLNRPFASIVASALGINRILVVKEHRNAYLRTIGEKWNDMAETILDSYVEGKARNEALADKLLLTVVSILKEATLEAPASQLCCHSTTQTLIYKSWVPDFKDARIALYRVLLLSYSIGWDNLKNVDRVLLVMPAELFATLAVKRLNALLDDMDTFASENMVHLLQFITLLCQICHHRNHKLARTLLELSAVDATLRATRFLHARAAEVSRRYISLSDDALAAAVICFKFFEVAFYMDISLMRKAIRKGFLNVLVRLSPLFQKMNSFNPVLWKVVENILIVLFPYFLICCTVYKARIRCCEKTAQERTGQNIKQYCWQKLGQV